MGKEGLFWGIELTSVRGVYTSAGEIPFIGNIHRGPSRIRRHLPFDIDFSAIFYFLEMSLPSLKKETS
jgi:hypothetical protein